MVSIKEQRWARHIFLAEPREINMELIKEFVYLINVNPNLKNPTCADSEFKDVKKLFLLHRSYVSTHLIRFSLGLMEHGVRRALKITGKLKTRHYNEYVDYLERMSKVQKIADDTLIDTSSFNTESPIPIISNVFSLEGITEPIDEQFMTTTGVHIDKKTMNDNLLDLLGDVLENSYKEYANLGLYWTHKLNTMDPNQAFLCQEIIRLAIKIGLDGRLQKSTSIINS